MWITDLIFGKTPRHRAPLYEAPFDVEWRRVRPREAGPAVRAWSATEDQRVRCMHGMLQARAGRDMIVEYPNGDRSVVRRDIFYKTYEPTGEGRYRKRTDVEFRYFIAREPIAIQTLEGMQEAQAGDWVMEGVEGELWPVDPIEAMRRYTPA